MVLSRSHGLITFTWSYHFHMVLSRSHGFYQYNMVLSLPQCLITSAYHGTLWKVLLVTRSYLRHVVLPPYHLHPSVIICRSPLYDRTTRCYHNNIALSQQHGYITTIWLHHNNMVLSDPSGLSSYLRGIHASCPLLMT